MLHRSQSGVDLKVIWTIWGFLFLFVMFVITLSSRNSATDIVSTSFRHTVGGCPSIYSGERILSKMTFSGFGVNYVLVPDSQDTSPLLVSIPATYTNGDGGLTRPPLLPIIDTAWYMGRIPTGMTYYKFSDRFGRRVDK